MWITYLARQIAGAAWTSARCLTLATRNRHDTHPIPTLTPHTPVAISLTTHGRRLHKVHYTIESLAHSGVPIILWLDKKDYDAPRPTPLKRLAQRGLDIRCSDGTYGPHTKYWGTFRHVQGTNTSIITVDDDMLYPTWFLPRLLERAAHTSNNSNPRDVITAYRAHRIHTHNGTLQPYVRWTAVNTTTPSILNFATGVSGVHYPPTFINYVVNQGAQFMQLSPHADDVWLHRCALRSNHTIQQVDPTPHHFNIIPTTQLGALVLHNTFGGGNDAQIAQVYEPQDIARLVVEDQRSTQNTH